VQFFSRFINVKSKTIRRVILLATLSLIGIIAIQIYWVQKAMIVQDRQVEIHTKQFNDRVRIALTHVAKHIQNINNDSTDYFNVVKQVSSNHFSVRINDTLHPYLLEALLVDEFSERNLKENFEYGIYDCFTDSLVSGGFVAIDSTHSNYKKINLPKTEWENDEHYFSVFFPNIEFYITPSENNSLSWSLASIIIMIIVVFFVFSIYVMLKQKRLADVKSDFINNMTHEFKTPISTISLSSELLLKKGIETEPDRIYQYAKIIHNENKRLESQVERVLQLATLDKEKIALKRSKINLHNIIYEVLERVELQVQKRNGKINTQLKSADPTINGDHIHHQRDWAGK